MKLAADAEAIAAAVPPPVKRKPLAPTIRALALDGLDTPAIAALTGASYSLVSTTVARFRRAGGDLPRRRGEAKAILIVLDAAARAALLSEAKRRGVAPHELAGRMVKAGLACAN
jgi:transposase